MLGVSTAQTKASKPAKNTPQPAPPIFDISLSDDSDLGSMSWAQDWPDPSHGNCNGDGNLYVWSWPPGLGMAAFTPKGIVTFQVGQMADIPSPYAHGGFISPSAVFIGVDGIRNPEQHDEPLEDAEGHKMILRKTTGERRRYIARFDKDGTYKGAITLDLPFYVSTFATFESGTMVAQGLDGSKLPRIALLDSNGQLIRYLQLDKDISAGLEVPAKELKYSGLSADAGSIVLTSEFTLSDGKILFLRSLASTTVYEIQESGEVRAVKVKAPDGYDVDGLIATDRNWLIRFRKPNPTVAWSDARHALFEVDPKTGALLREYRGSAPDMSVSCFFNNEFWVLRNRDGKLTVARGVADLHRGK